MVKIADRRKLKWCLVHYKAGETTSKWAAAHLGISQKRFQQLLKEYQATEKIPNIGHSVGRPKKEIPADWRIIIKQQYART